MPKHSPEPWQVVERKDAAGNVFERIAVDSEWGTIRAEGDDAERIVACVNACKDLSHSDLEALEKHGAAGYRRFIIRQFIGVVALTTKDDIERALEAVAQDVPLSELPDNPQ